MAANPSHLLISRNPRSPAHPQLAPGSTPLYSPTPVPGSHLFDDAVSARSTASGAYGAGGSSSGPGLGAYGYGSNGASGTGASTSVHGLPTNTQTQPGGAPPTPSPSQPHQPAPRHSRSYSSPAFPTHGSETDEDDEDIVVHPTFRRDAALPGRVKVVVGKHEFWCHKEVLWFASPFFHALLQGSWAETNGREPDCAPSPTDTDPVKDADHTHDGSPRAQTRAVAEPLQHERDDQPPTCTAPVTTTENVPVQPLPHPHHSQLPLDLHAPSPRSHRASNLSTLSPTSAEDEHTASVYLDAVEDGPSVADILRELRELPDPSRSPLEALLELEGDRAASSASPLTAGQVNGADHRPTSGSSNHLSTSHPNPSHPDAPERPRSAPTPTDTGAPPPTYTSSVSPTPAANVSTPAPTSPLAPDTNAQPHSRVASPLAPPLRLRPSGPCPPAVTTASARRGTGNWSTRSSLIEPVSWRASKSDAQEKVDAVVELHEESPVAFQDFLFWAYPHLECKITWTNVAGLLTLASKLLVSSLQKLCEHFLLTHASGRPVIALALAEIHGNAELYREASRFVLDQATWDAAEMDSLSEQTRLKLSMRRTWFLERLLKLGSIDVKKEYACRQDCPDPSRCQALLDEKWRQANQTVSRYGPPQPSIAFRCLRQLETFPTNPSLVMPHPLCQSTAKSWVMQLFDRMFQPKMTFAALSPGTEKYWLHITLTP